MDRVLPVTRQIICGGHSQTVFRFSDSKENGTSRSAVSMWPVIRNEYTARARNRSFEANLSQGRRQSSQANSAPCAVKRQRPPNGRWATTYARTTKTIRTNVRYFIRFLQHPRVRKQATKIWLSVVWLPFSQATQRLQEPAFAMVSYRHTSQDLVMARSSLAVPPGASTPRWSTGVGCGCA